MYSFLGEQNVIDLYVFIYEEIDIKLYSFSLWLD